MLQYIAFCDRGICAIYFGMKNQGISRHLNWIVLWSVKVEWKQLGNAGLQVPYQYLKK